MPRPDTRLDVREGEADSTGTGEVDFINIRENPNCQFPDNLE